jgi:hypothetical protein
MSQQAESRRDESLLNFYKKEWDRYNIAMRPINSIFHYLVRLFFLLFFFFSSSSFFFFLFFFLSSALMF